MEAFTRQNPSWPDPSPFFIKKLGTFFAQKLSFESGAHWVKIF
jgi:hypothetical protein